MHFGNIVRTVESFNDNNNKKQKVFLLKNSSEQENENIKWVGVLQNLIVIFATSCEKCGTFCH